jgi:hypothetical protein
MSLAFRPIGIILGILGGVIAQKLFDFIWAKVDDQEAPEPEHRDLDWGKFLVAMVVQGAIFRVIRGLVDHHSRRAFASLTGTWPGEEEPEPE